MKWSNQGIIMTIKLEVLWCKLEQWRSWWCRQSRRRGIWASQSWLTKDLKETTKCYLIWMQLNLELLRTNSYQIKPQGPERIPSNKSKWPTECHKAHVDDFLPAGLDVLDDVVDCGLDAAAGKQRVERRLRKRRYAPPEKYRAENDNILAVLHYAKTSKLFQTQESFDFNRLKLLLL